LKSRKPHKGWKSKLHEVIYEADTPKGKLFDIVLFFLIIASVILVMLESVKEIDAKYHEVLFALEWIITIFFTVEYIARIISIKKPLKYIFSFYGIIDFISTIPLYLSYTLMYLIEDDAAGFTSIPRSIYWAIVTLTTVGYGDIAPQTPLGQLLATIVMILGYGIIAVPTGIVTAEFAKESKNKQPHIDTNTQSCTTCSTEGHRDNATHCYNCGSAL